MKIAVFGTGGLGGYFGARLLQAGHDVAFIARGAHLEALRANGLHVLSDQGDLHMANIRVESDPTALDPVDLVLFLVKLYDTEAAAQALVPLLKPDSAVVSFQNGIDGWERIGQVVGMDRVIGGIAYIFANIDSPGVIRHNGRLARLVYGEFDGQPKARTAALKQALDSAGIDNECVNDIQTRIWEKFVVLSAISATTAITRLPVGAILRDEAARSLLLDALAETTAIGRAVWPALASDIADRQLAFVESLPFGMRASMLDDLEKGRPLEIDHLSGAVARLGRDHGIATPVHDTVYRALHIHASGAQALPSDQ